jgi:CRP-like cAMP-binding protein
MLNEMKDGNAIERNELNDVRIFRQNEILVEEGESDGGWFILLSGKIGVKKKGIQIAEYSEKGTILGELSVILQKPRTATLQALEETEVLCIHKSLDELIKNYPDVAKKIMVNIAERLAQTTEDLLTAIKK